MKDKTLTDTFVITKKYRSSNEFALYIDEKVAQKKITYMEAVIHYCEEMDIEIDSIGSLINSKLREKIQLEAEQINMLKPKGRLPL